MRAFLLLALLLAATPAFAKDWVAKPFTLRGVDGTTTSLSDYRGKVVVVEFFASWCGVCASAVPELNALAKRYPGKLEFVAIATAEDDPLGLEAFIEDNGPEYRILVDDTDRVARAYDVLVFPTYYVIDQNGLVQAFRRGEVEWTNKKVAGFIEGLLYPASTSTSTYPAAASAPAFSTSVTTVSR